MTEQQQGGSQSPAEALAEAAGTDETDGNVAVADEPATSPSLATEAAGSEAATAVDDEPANGATGPTSEAPTARADAPGMADARAAEAPEATTTDDAEAPEANDTEAPEAEAVSTAEDAPAAGATAAGDTAAGEATPAEPVPVTEVATEPATADAAAPEATAEAPAAPEAAAETPAAEAPAAPEPAPVPSGPEPTTMEELLAEQDADIKSFKHGDVVEGSVVRIDKDEILVDIGAKSEGVVSNRELFGRNTEAQPALNIGDTVLVYVLQPESPEGHVVLSLRRAGLERKWRSMQEQFEAGVIIEAPVIDHNKGGLIVDCGIRGFVPISQIVDFPRRPQNDQPRDAAQEIAEKLQPFVGRKLRLKILEVNRKANRLILSEKVALYEERREKRDELFSSLQVGQRVKGHVRSIAPFGVFVDLGGIDGLVHKSELSWNKVNNPEGGYRVGEEVEAEVIDINHERGRISLSIRRLQPDPWHSTVADFKVGDIIDGTVTKLVNFGAFVRVRDGLEGLIHISELSNQRVAHPGDVVHEGQQLKLRIISLDSERHRLGLSLKQAEEAPVRAAPEPSDIAAPAQPRVERAERPERGERRGRGDRERTRTYSAADAVQEPEGGIDTTLAAAFAGVREQLARAEAEDEGGEVSAEAAAEAPAADETATAEAPAADEPEAVAEADAVVEPEVAPEPEAVAEAEPAAEPEAIAEAEPAVEPEAVAETVVEPEPADDAATEAKAQPATAEPAAETEAEPVAEPEPAPARGSGSKAAKAEPVAAEETAADDTGPADETAEASSNAPDKEKAAS